MANIYYVCHINQNLNKMKTKIITQIAAVLIVLTLNSCAKKKGCTDTSAVNFNSSAEQDDGSCTYNGKLVFWWNKPLADSCAAKSVTNVKVYVDNVFQGTLAVSSQYWPSSPGCGANSTVTISRDLGKNKTQNINVAYTLTIGGVESAQFGTETIVLTANTCESYELN